MISPLNRTQSAGGGTGVDVGSGSAVAVAVSTGLEVGEASPAAGLEVVSGEGAAVGVIASDGRLQDRKKSARAMARKAFTRYFGA